MSNDAEPMWLVKHGTVTVPPHGGVIVAAGFEAEGASCRDVAIMACAWAIGELQREMLKCIESPGGGNIGID